MAPPRRQPASDGGMGDIWKWIAAIVGALLVGLTPFLLSQSAQKNYVQKEDLQAIAAQVVALSERTARNEEQITQAADKIQALLELAQNGDERLATIEAALARIEAVIQAQTATTGGTP